MRILFCTALLLLAGCNYAPDAPVKGTAVNVYRDGLLSVYMITVDEHQYITSYRGGIIHHEGCKKCQSNGTR